MAREDGLKFTLNQKSLSSDGQHSHKNGLSDLTVRSYKSGNAKFADFCKKELGIKTFSQLERYGASQAIQEYAKSLSERDISAHSIHTYLAPVCKACDVNMGEIEKPKRISADIKKGRYETARSIREQNLGRYKPSVELQQAIGVRVNELKKFEGQNLTMLNGNLYVAVERGKGGKYQLQRILPQHENTVLQAFSAVGKDERVLKPEQISKNINYHGMRADVAKEAYQYYANRLKNEPEYRKQLIKELATFYKKAHPNYKNSQANKFVKELINETPYKLRGENLKLALDKGLPIEYNRLALMAVSVEHLSHWRLDVTVNNYMLA